MSSHLSHYRRRSSSKAAYKASSIRAKRKALKQQGYEVLVSSSSSSGAGDGGKAAKSKKAKAGAGASDSSDDVGRAEAASKPSKSKATRPQSAPSSSESGRKEAGERRLREKRAYKRSKGKLSRVSGVLLGRIERRIREEGEGGNERKT